MRSCLYYLEQCACAVGDSSLDGGQCARLQVNIDSTSPHSYSCYPQLPTATHGCSYGYYPWKTVSIEHDAPDSKQNACARVCSCVCMHVCCSLCVRVRALQ